MHIPDPHRWFRRTTIGQIDCAARDLGHRVTVSKWHYKQKLAHSLHTGLAPTGTRWPVFGIALIPNGASQYRHTIAQIHCGARDLGNLVQLYLWKKRFPQVAHCLALHPFTIKGERMYYRARSTAAQRIWVISSARVLVN